MPAAFPPPLVLLVHVAAWVVAAAVGFVLLVPAAASVIAAVAAGLVFAELVLALVRGCAFVADDWVAAAADCWPGAFFCGRFFPGCLG